jgi:hypothetical protein
MTERYVAFTATDPQIIAALRQVSHRHAASTDPTTKDVLSKAWGNDHPSLKQVKLNSPDVIRAATYIRRTTPTATPPETEPAGEDALPTVVEGAIHANMLHLHINGSDHTYALHTAAVPIDIFAGDSHSNFRMKKIGRVTKVAHQDEMDPPTTSQEIRGTVLPQTAHLCATGALQGETMERSHAGASVRSTAVKVLRDAARTIQAGPQEPQPLKIQTTLEQAPHWLKPNEPLEPTVTMTATDRNAQSWSFTQSIRNRVNL